MWHTSSLLAAGVTFVILSLKPGASLQRHGFREFGYVMDESWSGFARQFGLFDIHILEFAGFEDVTTLQAFDKFGVLLASDDLHARMLTLIHSRSLHGDCDGGMES